MKKTTLMDILTRQVITVPSDASVRTALEQMRQHRISAVVVMAASKPVGILTERDAVLISHRHDDLDAPVSQVMSGSLVTAPSGLEVSEAYQILKERGIRHLLVVDDQGDLVGIVSESDFLTLYEQELLDDSCMVGSVMTRPALTLAEEATLGEAVELMANKKISCVLVERDRCPVGMLTERDLVRLTASGQVREETPLRQLMSQPVSTVQTGASLTSAMQMMDSGGFRRIVVVDEEGRIFGVLTRHDVVNKLYHRHIEQLQETIDQLRQELAQRPDLFYRHFIEQGVDLVLIAEMVTLELVECNQQACRQLGYQREQLLRFSLPQLSALFSGAEWPQVLAQLNSGHGRIIETELRTADGGSLPVELSLSRVESTIGTSLLLVARDISERLSREQALARSELAWIEAMDQFNDAIYMTDVEHRLLRANAAFYRLVGKGAEQCLGQRTSQLLHPDCEERFCELCRLHSQLHDGVLTLEVGAPANPSDVPIEVVSKVLHDSSGRPSGMLVSIHDLSRTRLIDEKLRLSDAVFQNTQEGVVITDTETRVLNVNPAFCHIMGYAAREVIGGTPGQWKSGRHDQSFYRDLWSELKETGRWRGEIWNRRKDGDLFPTWMNISAVRDLEGAVRQYVAVFSDISEIKRSQEQMTFLAHHDALTGLPNRLLFNARLDHALKRAERHHQMLAVIFLDLDRFKNINDSLGHQEGDRLLRNVARMLTETVRADDTVARIGGDEFILLLEGVSDTKSITLVVEKILSAFQAPFVVKDQEIPISSSMGISLFPRDGLDALSLMKNADAAMYRAKEEGRNNYQFYTHELTGLAFERMLLESNLHRALDRSELCLYYQPQFDLESGRIVGLEALLRWLHPDMGMVSPAKFIPLAEETGLIYGIGEWVLMTACQQAESWRLQGLHFGRMAVNVSGRQMQRGDLSVLVGQALERSGLPADKLELELTETFIMQEAQRSVGQLDRLRSLGVMLAVDDFGTGYSSLSYLKRLPIDKLKIDQSFVRDLANDPNDMAIARAIIVLGKSLNLTVIAEGVEHEPQIAFLREAGCQQAQGFWYSRPLPAVEMEAFLKCNHSIRPEHRRSD